MRLSIWLRINNRTNLRVGVGVEVEVCREVIMVGEETEGGVEEGGGRVGEEGAEVERDLFRHNTSA